MRGRAVPPAVGSIAGVVGFLVCVELASGVLQGFYTPIFTDIADRLQIAHGDVNWFEAAQLVVSALVVPVLARLGDLVGHRAVLLGSTVVTAAASWAVALAPGFTTFLIAWALQGFYVVWLPMEVAIIHRRTDGDGRRTRTAAGILVGALELGVILAALASGALVTVLPLTVVLMIPAVIVSLALVAIAVGVRDDGRAAAGRIDLIGFALITGVLALLMGGLVVLRLTGPGDARPWLALLAAAALAVPFVRHELGTTDPLIDLRVLAAPGQWPVQLTAFLFGASVLGAQIPLSTYARTDPTVAGYGLGVDAAALSLLIGAYVLALAVGALGYPPVSARTGPRTAMVLACLLVAVGYLMFLPWHGSVTQLTTNMVVAGLGSGALVAALPAAAVAAAPATHTGQASGMTNTTKTIGGAVASSVFAIALASTGSLDDAGVRGTYPAFGGYLTVWTVCGATALVAAVSLMTLSRRRPDAHTPARR